MDTLPIDDDVLSAWLDGELDPTLSARVQAHLREHPEVAARVQHWRADAQALRKCFAPVLQEPVPEALHRRIGPPAANRMAWQQVAFATGLWLAGAALGAGALWQAQRSELLARPAPENGAGWVQRASLAHAVYVPEVRHPVEVDTRLGSKAEQLAQEEHLSRWLTKRLSMPVKTFDLRAQGYELVGGRLLPDARAASAQLMYENQSGQRVTVYLRKPEAATPAAFRYERQGELGLFYWVDGPSGYALVGALPREQLLALAEAIYRQGQAAPLN